MYFNDLISNRAGKARTLFAGAAFLALLALACFGTQAAAMEPESGSLKLESIVPEDTLIFIKSSGLDELLAEGETLQLMKLWTDPEIQAFLAEARAQLPEKLGMRDGGEWGGQMKQVKRLLQGGLAMSISSRLTLFEEGAAPAMALAMDMGADKEGFLGIMKGVRHMILQKSKMQEGSWEHRGFKIHYLGNLEKRWTLCHTIIDNLLILSINRYYLKDIIDHHLDGKAGLAHNPAFRACLNKVGGPSTDLLFYASLKPLLDMVRPVAPYEVTEWLELLGLNHIDAFCLASTMEGGRSRESLFIHCPGEKQGLLKALVPHPVSRESLQSIPPDAMFCTSFVFDPEKILKEIDSFVKSALPEYYGHFRSGLDQMKKETSFDLEKEVLGPLGSEITFFGSFPKNGVVKIPNFFATVTLDDVEGFVAFKNRLLAMFQSHGIIKDSKYKDYTFQYFTPPESPYSPTFAVVGKRLVLATSPMALKQYLVWLEKGEPGIFENEQFKAALADVPKNASLVSFLDLRQGILLGYNTLAPFIPGKAAQMDVPIDAGMMPMAETIAQHFTTVCSYMVSDKDGWLMTKRTPLGLSSFLALTAHVVDYFVAQNLLPGAGGQATQKKKVAVKEPGMEDAFRYMEEGDFKKAEACFGKAMPSQSGSDLIEALLNRGYCRLKLGRNQEAIEDYAMAAEKEEACRYLAYYNIACGTSLMNQKEKAIKFLEMAVDAGFEDWDLLTTDPDLANIRQDPRYAALVNKKM